MKKYCEKCGHRLKHGLCPICDQDQLIQKPPYFWYSFLLVILTLSILVKTPLKYPMQSFINSVFNASITTISNKEYEDVTYKLAKSGQEVTVMLSAGNYVVGQDLPEGLYRVENNQGFGAIWIDDDTNDIHINKSLDNKDEADGSYFSYYLENVRLYQGARIQIFTNSMTFTTSNGQIDKWEERETNPNTETFEIDHSVMIGDTIPAGTYDILVIEGSGSISSEKSWNYGISESMTADKEDTYDVYRYNNVELENEEKLTLEKDDDCESFKIQLIPSNGVRKGNNDEY